MFVVVVVVVVDVVVLVVVFVVVVFPKLTSRSEERRVSLGVKS